MTAFMMDFDNQIIPVSESAGGMGAGEINAGRTMHRGAEASLILGIGELADLPFRLDFDANVTYVDAFFNADRFQEADDVLVNVNGNRTPYAPEWLVSSALTLEMKNGFGIRLTGTYISEQFTDPVNSITPTANGRDGLIDSYFVLDGTLRYNLSKWNTTFSLSCKNMLDERYMVSRRPQGIRAGLPRFITAGVNVNF
jgi:Fe(3+) dicitrate transport protein